MNKSQSNLYCCEQQYVYGTKGVRQKMTTEMSCKIREYSGKTGTDWMEAALEEAEE
jgi:hypothetical protein